LRTERVVIRTSSADKFRVIWRDYIRVDGSRIHARGVQQALSRSFRVVDHGG
jgi:hypothetical protein